MNRACRVEWKVSLAARWLGLLTLSWSCGCSQQPSTQYVAPSHDAAAPIQSLEEDPKCEPLTVRITGHEFQWRIDYPGPDGILDTDDDILGHRNLHLPADGDILLELCSDDFAYTLFLPHYDFLDVAMPESPFVFEFTTDSVGNHKLLGSQMCGYTHPLLIGRLIVHSKEEFETWLASMR